MTSHPTNDDVAAPTAAATPPLDESLLETAHHWRNENREAISGSNDYVIRHGLPLAQFRQF